MFLTFIPGTMILRVLGVYRIDSLNGILYSIGLSLASIMFLGLLINFLLPLLEINNPISFNYLVTTILVFTVILTILIYFKNYNEPHPQFHGGNTNFSLPHFLYLTLIPFLTIIATFVMNTEGNNILLMILILLIGLTAIFVAFNLIKKNLYPYAIFIIGISLLYHGWLISNYIWGTDIHFEYFFSNLVITNAYWNFSIPTYYNGMLSITMIGPIYSILTGIGLTWTYKIIYPFFFSLVPLGIYAIAKEQTNDKIAFLSAFFFTTSYFFIVWMMPLKQQIAELFIVLLLLALIEKKIDGKIKAILLITFGSSIVVSHYGTSYIFIMFLIGAIFILYLFDSEFMSKINLNLPKSEKKSIIKNNLTLTFVLLYLVISIAWYIYISSATNFTKIILIGNHIAGSITSEIFDPEAVKGLAILSSKPQTGLGYIHKFLYLLSQFFISMGIIGIFIGITKKLNCIKIKKEYLAFGIVTFMVLIFSVVLPYFSSAIYTPRLFQITLVILSPFCIIGILTIFWMIIKITNNNKKFYDKGLKFASIFLVLLLLFNTGFIDEILKTDRIPNDSIPISEPRLNSYNFNVFEQDVYGSEWISKESNKKGLIIYSDIIGQHPLTSYGGLHWSYSWNQIFPLTNSTVINGYNKDTFIYISYQNLIKKLMLFSNYEKINESDEFIDKLNNNTNLVYSNGGNLIFKN